MSQLVNASRPRRIRLSKDLLREVKRGHAWLYPSAVEPLQAASGTVVAVWDRSGERFVGWGIYDPDHPLPVRVCTTSEREELNDSWLIGRLQSAWDLRQAYFGKASLGQGSTSDANSGSSSLTTGFRWLAGEGDGVPGLIVDVYGRTAVIKLDGGAPADFYRTERIADWIVGNTYVEQVVQRFRERGRPGEFVAGQAARRAKQEIEPVAFLENGMRFTADVMHGQKTGFFLDQRDNRDLVRRLAKGRQVLNLYAYNGGFSIAAGLGGAEHVTSVDIAGAAIQDSHQHWVSNGLAEKSHAPITEDCFEFLKRAGKERRQWDLVICDPPSFARSERAKPQAIEAYAKLARMAAAVTSHGGLLAVASCSSHVSKQAFLETNYEALGKARRRANLLADRGLPIDHPTPLAMPELRYLKFLLLQLD
jgi:23S rRNA (cytosine1962-C5)-methyltransferase